MLRNALATQNPLPELAPPLVPSEALSICSEPTSGLQEEELTSSISSLLEQKEAVLHRGP